MSLLKIGKKKIGIDSPAFIIAEAGINHNGELKIAKKLIDSAKRCNVDAVKFQTFTADDLASTKSSYYKLFKKVELSESDFSEISDYAKQKDIIFLSTPFSNNAVDILSKMKIPAFKISSGDLTDLPLINYVAKKNKPVLLSTGMATFNEIKNAVNEILKTKNRKIGLFHSVSAYPTPYSQTNLLAMQTMMKEFSYPIGYSDNGPDMLVPEVAVSMGAKLIEKHFTLDKNMPGPDQKLSLNLNELSELVKGCKAVKLALGDSKKILVKEKPILKFARESVVSLKKISKGEKFSEKNISTKRPATGDIPAKDYYKIIGRSAKRNISDNIQLSQNDVY